MQSLLIPKRHSVALKILVNSSVINTATIRVTFGSSLTFHSFRHGSITPQRAHNMVQQSGQYITLTILNTDNFVAGTHLVTLYFDSSTGVTNPVSLLSQQVTAITTDNGSTLSTPFTYVTAMLGDVTGNNTVNSDDQLSILRYVTGKESFNAVQLLAGDVDFNGSVDSSDALMVGKYPVGKVKSFVDIDRIFLPEGTVDGLNEYLTYRIKNVQSNNYIKTDAQNNAVLGAADTVLSTEFSIILSDTTRPIYRLVSRDNSLELRLDSNHNITFDATQAQYNSQYWFIIPKGEQYLLINFAEYRKTLGNCGRTTTTAACGTSYLEYGNLWEITPMIRIKSFYDLGYKARKGSTAASELHEIQRDIGAIITTVFGVETAIPSPYAVVSHADSCHGSDLTAISITQANAACGRSAGNTSPCENYTDLNDPPNSNVHHKNSRAVLYHFKTSSYNDPYRYELLYSGHKACGKSSKTNEHAIDVVAGVSLSSSTEVGEVFYIGSSKEYRLRLTGLHELCHMLGATGGNVDNLHYEDSNGKGMCVMSSSRNNTELLRYWQQSNFSALYCPTCKGLIANHLQLALEEE